jgi:hypothetical protein
MKEEVVVTTLPQGLATVLGTQNNINVHTAPTENPSLHDRAITTPFTASPTLLRF